MKTKPSKTKIFLWKLILVIHSIIYHHQELPSQKELICSAKVIEGPEAPKIFIDSVVYRFHYNVTRVLNRFLTDTISFRVLSDRVFFESSEVWSSALGSEPWAICYYFFYQKQTFCFAFIIILKNN